MSEGDGSAAGEDNPPAGQDQCIQCILDAVICVHFVGAGAHRLLVKVLREHGMTLLVPAEVAEEIAGLAARKYPGIKNPWTRLAASSCIEILPKVDTASDPRLLELLSEARRRQGEELEGKRNFGEAAVIAHGAHRHENGAPVCVAIDDAGAQAVAWSFPGLTVLTMEDVLVLAVHLGEFTTEGELKKLYVRLRQYGQSLVPYERTKLAVAFKEWKSAPD